MVCDDANAFQQISLNNILFEFKNMSSTYIYNIHDI